MQIAQRKPKLALVCGNLIFRGYVEVFRGVEEHFDLTAFTWNGADLPTNDLKFHKRSVQSLSSFLPESFPVTRLLRRQLDKKFGGGYVVGLEKRLREFDICYTQETYTPWTLQAIRSKLKFGNKVVVQVIENLPFRRETEKHNLYAKQAANRHADLFIAQTQQAYDVCVAEGAPESKVKLVPLAVDSNFFVPSEKSAALLHKLDLTSKDKIVLFVGRILWAKGILDFVEAAAILLKRVPAIQLKFLIVGTGPDQYLLDKYIDYFDVRHHVRQLSRQDYERMPAIFNLADVCVVPSLISDIWEEQFGMVLAESMSCAKPVVTTTTGAIPEVVGNCALTVPCRKPEALAAKIEELLVNEAHANILGHSARDWVIRRYSIGVVSTKLRDCFETLNLSKLNTMVPGRE